MATAKYLSADSTVAGPALGAKAVTPSDTVDLPRAPARGLWIGAGGSVKVDCVDGSTETIPGANAGSVIPLQVTRVYATGTTAGSIIAFY